jgi:hypothetical protein
MASKYLIKPITFFVLLSFCGSACSPGKNNTELPITGQSGTVTPTQSTAKIGTPSVELIYPPSNYAVYPGEQISIRSFAISPPPGSVNRIELWSDGMLYSTFTNPNPGETVMLSDQIWSSKTVGSHSLNLLAYNNQGEVSAPFNFKIDVNSTNLLSAWIAQPSSTNRPITVQPDTAVPINYWGFASAGVDRLELWSDGQLYASDASPDHASLLHVQHDWVPTKPGIHSLYVKVFDIIGDSANSSSLSINVIDMYPPEVGISSPSNNEQIEAGHVIPITISASDDKGISHLELWIDGLLYGSWENGDRKGISQIRMKFAWQMPVEGPHVLYARAFDTAGLSAVTNQITVVVLPPSNPGVNHYNPQ